MIELRAKDELKTQQFEMESKKKLNELAKKLGKLPTNCKKIHPQ